MASVTSTSISSWASSRSPSRRNCGSLPCSSLRSRSKSAILKVVIVSVLPSVDSATHLEPHCGPFCQRARNLHHYLLLNSGQRHRPSRKKKVRKSRWQDEWTISLDHPAGHVVADVESGSWPKVGCDLAVRGSPGGPYIRGSITATEGAPSPETG